MGKGKRNQAIVISSSSDDGEDKSSSGLSKTGLRSSKSAPTRKNPKRAKRVSQSHSHSRPLELYGFSDFDELKKLSEEFDQGFTQFKVTSGSRSSKDQWVEKYKPSCLEELAVHKKKVEEVKRWLEEKLQNSEVSSRSNVILLSGQAGVGKSATIYAIACHLGAEVLEWNAPTPTIWQEHLHHSNSGIQYISKLDEFESFVERIRKYGVNSSSLTQVSPSPVIFLVDDLPVVNGKIAGGRLKRCLHLLVQSVCLPTAILINDCGRSEYVDHGSRYWEELQLSLQNAGAFKVTFNPVTVNSIKKVLSKICKAERFEVSDAEIGEIAKASGGDIRHAITSLQYFSLKPHSVHSTSLSKTLPASLEDKVAGSADLDGGFPMPFGKDETISLFHALGKFLHNKREDGGVGSDGAIRLKEKYVRCPLKMDAPELVLSQAHCQARSVGDFLHENVLDFLSEEAIEDAWVVSTYLSDTDLLLSPPRGSLLRNFEAENLVQSIAASVAVRGVLFGNTNPVSRWHAIRRPRIWQVEQSIRLNKFQMVSERTQGRTSIILNRTSAIATEFRPALNYWLRCRTPESNEVYSIQDKHCDSGLDSNADDEDEDEIEEW
ncbi:cell cycle checkpoint protein RAD17 isoform X1 [Andrographis paniculata]|uniref:cell cycle checkpoint protein RAD17 isoform X1 n=1 Tax=Andrographis paniculata TaxID=175694 RepID=UPI0021E86073|nr:cell cycle checkpoint protein RAD17 isoform X1 [Andrographis paniculata]